jgi:hypothetical protein
MNEYYIVYTGSYTGYDIMDRDAFYSNYGSVFNQAHYYKIAETYEDAVKIWRELTGLDWKMN